MSLIGKNLALEPYSSCHQNLLQDWMNSWDALLYYRDEVLIHPPEDQAWGGLGTFIVTRNRDSTPLGCVGILDLNLLHRKARLDFHILPKYRNLGYGIESGILLMYYCFNYLNLHKVFLTIYESNSHAIEVSKRLGYRQDGILREHILKNNKYLDVLVFSLLEREYFEYILINKLVNRYIPKIIR
jgi:UDP-4-amino-4,6-dideoxy-N-acetyl-beta-L-altrosamine N-acetyltransferase